MTARLYFKSCPRCCGDVYWEDGEPDCLHCGWTGHTVFGATVTKDPPPRKNTMTVPRRVRIEMAKELYAIGLTQRLVAKQMGVDNSTVQEYLRS